VGGRQEGVHPTLHGGRQGRPSLTVLAGPNGSGKSTITTMMGIREVVGVEYVNADDIKVRLGVNDATAARLAEGGVYSHSRRIGISPSRPSCQQLTKSGSCGTQKTMVMMSDFCSSSCRVPISQ
jgi:predicted ABC-type ATPase